AALFAFAALALSAPSTALVVLLLVIATTSIIWYEWLDNRRTKATIQKAKANPNLIQETMDELRTFGQVFGFLAVPTIGLVTEEVVAIWVVEVENIEKPSISNPSER